MAERHPGRDASVTSQMTCPRRWCETHRQLRTHVRTVLAGAVHKVARCQLLPEKRQGVHMEATCAAREICPLRCAQRPSCRHTIPIQISFTQQKPPADTIACSAGQQRRKDSVRTCGTDGMRPAGPVTACRGRAANHTVLRSDSSTVSRTRIAQ